MLADSIFARKDGGNPQNLLKNLFTVTQERVSVLFEVAVITNVI